MIFSVCIGALSEQTEAKLDLLQRCRIKGVEIPGRVLERNGEEDPNAYRQSLRIAAERLPQVGVHVVSVHLPFWPADISSLDPDERRVALGAIARSLIGYAEYFPGGLAVVHPGDVVSDPDTEPDRIQQSIDSLRRIAELAEELTVRLAIENMPSGAANDPTAKRIGQDVDFLLRAIKQIGSARVGVCLDTGHANITGDVCEMARRCGDKLMHVHLADNDGAEDGHLPPGEGTVPWARLGDVLYQIGFNEAAVLEVGIRADEPYEQVIIESRSQLVDWVW